MNNQALESVTSERLLDVVVDQNLTWKGHVDKVHRTVSMLLSKFQCIKPFLPTYGHIKYCQAFISPHLDYCSTVWGSTQLQRLYNLQKRAARMIFDLPTQTPTKSLLEKLNRMYVMDRVEYRWATMVHKSLNGTAPDYMKEMLNFVTDISQIQTRYLDNYKLYLPTCNHLKVCTDSFEYAAGAV